MGEHAGRPRTHRSIRALARRPYNTKEAPGQNPGASFVLRTVR